MIDNIQSRSVQLVSTETTEHAQADWLWFPRSNDIEWPACFRNIARPMDGNPMAHEQRTTGDQTLQTGHADAFLARIPRNDWAMEFLELCSTIVG